MKKVAAVLCSGGPAPGLNGVIRSAVVELAERRYQVLGFIDGFSSLVKGKPKFVELTAADTSEIERQGGSIIGTSRTNARATEKQPRTPAIVAEVLHDLDVSLLITIGGNDTFESALAVAEASRGAVRVVHVPKTIDNDLPLDPGLNTFGFDTAATEGGSFTRVLLEDSRTTGDRHFLCVCMGRDAGYLSLKVAKAAEALCLLPEEVGTGTIELPLVATILAGALIKKEADTLHSSRPIHDRGGVFVIAEGIIPRIKGIGDILAETFPKAQGLVLDDNGNPRLSKVPSQNLLEWAVTERLEALGVPAKLAARGRKAELIGEKIGFGLRCANPTWTDVEYTSALGAYAARYGDDGASEVVVVQELDGTPALKPFAEMRGTREVALNDPDFQELLTKRLLPQDLEGERLKELAGLTNLTPSKFARAFRRAAQFSARHLLP